jgi:hypothetical protein
LIKYGVDEITVSAPSGEWTWKADETEPSPEDWVLAEEESERKKEMGRRTKV